MAEVKDESRNVGQEVLGRLIKETVDALVQDDAFIEKLASRISHQLSGGTTAAPQETSYWEVVISDHPLNDKSFRMFIETGDGPVTVDRLQFVDNREPVRQDVLVAILDQVLAGEVAPGKLYWVNLTHISSSNA